MGEGYSRRSIFFHKKKEKKRRRIYLYRLRFDRTGMRTRSRIHSRIPWISIIVLLILSVPFCVNSGSSNNDDDIGICKFIYQGGSWLPRSICMRWHPLTTSCTKKHSLGQLVCSPLRRHVGGWIIQFTDVCTSNCQELHRK